MEKSLTILDEFILVGLTARTNNKNEINPKTSKIASLAQAYWHQQIAQLIKHRRQPGVTYAAYTEYESDENGDYTYFIGEAVNSTAGQDLSRFKVLTIPKSGYLKLTTPSGKMPDVVIDAWQQIWQMNPSDFGGKRKYIVDFEIYDEKAMDPEKTVVDIYIGVESS